MGKFVIFSADLMFATMVGFITNIVIVGFISCLIVAINLGFLIDNVTVGLIVNFIRLLLNVNLGFFIINGNVQSVERSIPVITNRSFCLKVTIKVVFIEKPNIVKLKLCLFLKTEIKSWLAIKSSFYVLGALMVIELGAKDTVVALATAFGVGNASKYQMSFTPDVPAYAKNTYVIVPQEAVLSGKEIVIRLVKAPLEAVPKVDLLFVTATLA
jgi:hypothetical protein